MAAFFFTTIEITVFKEKQMMLKTLSKDEFARRCAGGRRTPVFREYLADRETPVSVLTRISDEPKDVFLLESVYNGERKGRYSYLGIDPVAVPDDRPFAAAPELPAASATSPTRRSAISSRAFRAAARRGLPPSRS